MAQPKVTRASRKRKHPSEEEVDAEDEDPQMNGETGPARRPSNNETLLQSGASARGMTLRSGRKKRRRSRDTSGLTPDEQKVNGHKNNKEETEGSKDEDESMDDDESSSDAEEEGEDDEQQEKVETDEEEQGKKQSSSQASAPAAPAPSVPPAAAAASGPDVAAAPGVAAAATANDSDTQQPFMERVKRAENVRKKGGKKGPQVAPSGFRIGSRRLFADTPLEEQQQAGEENDERSPAAPAGQPAVTEVIRDPPSVERQTEELRSILAEGRVLPEDADVVREDAWASWSSQLYESASSACVTLAVTIQEVSTSLIFPKQQEEEKEEVGTQPEDENVETKPTVWMRTDVWLLILLVLQLCFWPIWIHPILTTVMESSDASLQFYKSVLGTKKTKRESTIANKTVAVSPEPAVLSLADDIPSISMEGFLQVSGLLKASHASLTSGTVERSRLKSLLHDVGAKLNERQEALTTWEATLGLTEEALEFVIAAASTAEGLAGSLPDEARTTIAELGKISSIPLTSSLIDVASLPVGVPPLPPNCTDAGDKSSLDDAFLTPQQLATQEASLREHALSSVASFVAKPEPSQGVRSWVRDQVREALKLESTSISSGKDGASMVGLSENAAKDAIFRRIEIERADQTGKIDYASLAAGASVIRTGTRATSPSLVDTLPLFNRWMASVQLRFYGHGPEAALTPTIPNDALGQCWAFENSAKMKNEWWRTSRENEDSCGAYGTLTVRLAKPVRVTSIAIEHAPKERTNLSNSAIRDFRVIGYADADAEGVALLLGKFRYDVYSGISLQEFAVASESNGSPIPPIQAITVAIDSNWGLDYSCLYRFRVHGDVE